MILYAVYHKDCGHILGIHNERRIVQRQIEYALTVNAMGSWGWRVRAGVTDAQIDSLMRGDRCAKCSIEAAP